MSYLFSQLNTKQTKRLALALALVFVAVVALVPKPAHAFLWGLFGKMGDAVIADVIASMVNMVLTLASWLLWLAGLIFNYSVDKTLNMSGLLANIPVVDIGWRIIRDIANIVFIFIALWSGISITLGLRAEKAWGLLAQMVLVALFINFSLFITKAVVDGTNIAALHFYSLMKDPARSADKDAGISDAFMNGLRLQTLWNSKTLGGGGSVDAAATILKAGGVTETSEWNIVLVGVFGSVFLVVTAFVFFAAAILFIIRAITLIMLMILSPLAFVAWILPGAQGLASKWWSTLWNQAFFAPIYMALAYVVVATINSPAFGANLNGLSFAAAFTTTNSPDSPHTALLFNFLIIIGLMIGCLIVAQNLGAKGSGMVMNMGGKLKALGMGAVAGAGGMLARTALRGGEPLAESKFAKRLGLSNALKKTSVRYWNERWEQSGGLFGGHGAVGKWARQHTTGRLVESKIAGKSTQEAYKEAREDTSVRRDIALGNTTKSQAEKLRGERERKQRLDENAKNAEREVTQAEAKLKTAQAMPGGPARAATVVAAQQELQNAQNRFALANGARNESVQQQTQMLAEISLALRRMTTQGFLKLPKEYFKRNELMDPEVLGADKYNALMANEHFTEDEKQEYTEARLERYHGEEESWNERHAEWLKEWKKYQAEVDSFEKEKTRLEQKHHVDTAKNELKTAQEDFAEKKKDPRTTQADKTAAEQAVQTKRGALKTARQALETDQEWKNLKEKKPVAPKAPSWQNDILSKSLRNIRTTDELINYYRYDPSIFDFKQFSATVMQGQWDRLRESDKIDTTFKEKGRRNKRYYVQEAADLQLGLDPELMARWETANTNAAKELRKTLNDAIKKLGPKKYMEEFFDKNGINNLLKQSSMKGDIGAQRFGAEDATTKDERELRRKSGKSMYPYIATNLSDDEFAKMPGAYRNLDAVIDDFDRSKLIHFKGRDIEDKVPIVEELIKRFQRGLEGTAEISNQNLDALIWLINERSGKEFIPWAQLDAELQPIWEIIKMLGKQRNDPLPSQYSSKEEALDDIETVLPSATVKENLFNKIGKLRSED